MGSVLNIGICEDHEVEQKQIMRTLEKVLEEKGLEASLSCFLDSESLIQHIKEDACAFDILFLDMYIDHQTGLDIAKYVRQINKRCAIVFITFSTDKIIECFPYRIADYLLKPFDEKGIEKVLGSALDYLEQVPCFELTIKSAQYRIPYDAMIYFESRLKYVELHYEGDESPITFLGTLSNLEEILTKDFRRCHKSYMVHLKQVYKLNKAKHQFEMKNGEVIPISRTYYSTMAQAFFEYHTKGGVYAP